MSEPAILGPVTAQQRNALAARRPGLVRSNRLRWAGLVVGLGVLAILLVISIAVGSRAMPLATIWEALLGRASGNDAVVIQSLRLPRTLLALIVGAALGLAGALIQALTRNPLADPGILGVNAGAALAVVLGIAVLGLADVSHYIWLAFVGAIIATSAVYLVGSSGRAGGTPIQLTLAGIALGAVFNGIALGFTLLHPETFEHMRGWNAGSLAGRGHDILWPLLPFFAMGLLAAALAAGPLNAAALGEDLGSALGVNLGRLRILVVVAVTLLVGAATAAVGPIGFVGLMVPHIARWITGPDQRWIFAYTLVLAPALLLGADIGGRLLLQPAELPAGIVTAFIGAPVLIVLIRRRKASSL